MIPSSPVFKIYQAVKLILHVRSVRGVEGAAQIWGYSEDSFSPSAIGPIFALLARLRPPSLLAH